MIRVLIESPYAGKSPPKSPEYWWEVERNLTYLRAAMSDCFKRGEAPFASHALYTQKGVLDDTIAEERQLGIDAGLLWGAQAEKTVLYVDLGFSRGMEYGIANAVKAGRPIEVRSLPEWAPKDVPTNDNGVCTTPNGRTDSHGEYVVIGQSGALCAFCKKSV